MSHVITGEAETILERGAAFLKPVLLVLWTPRRFFRSCFERPDRVESLTVPFLETWRTRLPRPGAVMPARQCLLKALAVLGVVLFVQGVVMQVVLPSDLVHAMQQSEASLSQFYEQMTGRSLLIIDTQHLTGLFPIDGPIGEFAQLVRYLFFAVVFALFLGRPRDFGRVMDYFAYVLAVSVLLMSIAVILATGVFIPLLIWPDLAFVVSGMIELLGDLPKLAYCLVAPIVLFPSILDIKRSRVVLATVLSALVWMGSNAFLSLLMMQFGILIKW